MAGLLDFLDTPGASMGLGLLAAGGPTTDPNAAGFGASLARGVQMGRAMQDQQTDKQLKQAYLQGQIDAQKRAEREYQDKKAAQSTYLGLLGFAPGAGGATGGAAGPMSSGSGPAAAPAGGAPAPGVGGQFSVGGLSPEQVLAMQAYAKQSGMPDPTEVWKLARPDMQVSGGYAYDKNRVQPGFLPSLNVSQNGQASLVLPGPNGLPVVMAPQGAVDTARAYADVGNISRAATTPGRPTILPGGRMGGQSQAAEMGMGGGPAIGTGAGYANEPAMRETAALQTDAASAEAARREIAAMQRDLATPGKVPDQASRAAIQAEIQRLSGQLAANPAAASKPAIGPGAAVVPGGGVEFSPEEKAQQAATQASAVKKAEADVVRDTAQQAGNKQFQQMQSNANKAMELLNQKPTGSGIGAWGDAAMGFIGQPTASSKTADALEALSGWMVANVPRMEGPQSNVDVLNYQKMAGRVGDRSLPVENRKEALAVVMDLQNKYAAINNGKSAQAASGSAADNAIPSGWTVKAK